MQPARSGGVAHDAHPVGEQNHRDGGRQGEAEPCRERPRITGARETDRNPDLAAGGSRQELAERDQIDVALLVEPATAHDEFLVEVA
jgi:hypothetical protein